jgi:hypothetical protein
MAEARVGSVGTERLLNVSKLDAARRQLETAVTLYFDDGDPVSIHTLTAAAHQVIADLSKKRGGRRMIIDVAVEKTVRPEKRAEARKIVRAAANFLKHADNDADATLSLLVSQSEFLLLDAVLQYAELTGEFVPRLRIYAAWFWLGPGKDFVDPGGAVGLDGFRKAFAGASKQKFLADALRAIAEQPPGEVRNPFRT